MVSARFSQFFTVDAWPTLFLWAGMSGKQGIEGLEIPFQADSAGNFAAMLIQECAIAECAPFEVFIERAGRRLLAGTYLFCVSRKDQQNNLLQLAL